MSEPMTECLTHDFYDDVPCPHCAEVDALRAEIAALKVQLATYIALRDRLIAWQQLPAYGEGAFKVLQNEMDAIVKQAQELAATATPPTLG